MSLTTCKDKLGQASLFPRVGMTPSAAAGCLHTNYIIRLGIHRALGWQLRGLAIRLQEQNPAHCAVLAPGQPIWTQLVPIAKKRYLRGRQQFNFAHKATAAAKL